MPAFLDGPEPREVLRAYVGTYLQEEIQAEGLTRSIGNFGRFLEVAGLTNGEQMNFAAVASDAGLAPSTVREHYRILEDTLVGEQLPAFRKTRTRKPVASERGGRLAVIQLVQPEDEWWRPPVLSASSDSHPVAS